MAFWNGVRTRTLSRYECRIIDALGERLIPPGGGIPYSAKDVGMVAFVDQLLMDFPGYARIAFRFVFVYLDLLARFTYFRTFPDLSSHQQDALLERLRMNKRYTQRSLYVIINTPFQMGFYADSRVTDHIGFFGNRSGQNKIQAPPA